MCPLLRWMWCRRESQKDATFPIRNPDCSALFSFPLREHATARAWRWCKVLARAPAGGNASPAAGRGDGNAKRARQRGDQARAVLPRRCATAPATAAAARAREVEESDATRASLTRAHCLPACFPTQPTAFLAAAQDAYQPDFNPSGTVVLAVAENKLSHEHFLQLVRARGADEPPPESMGYDDMRGLPRLRDALAATLARTFMLGAADAGAPPLAEELTGALKTGSSQQTSVTGPLAC